MILTYSTQLLRYANQHNVVLKDAFRRAGIPDSTFYRSVVGKRSLRLSIAEKVCHAIEQLASERDAPHDARL